MPYQFFRPSESGVVVVDDDAWIIDTKGVGLRRSFSTDTPGLSGDLVTEAVVTFPNWTVEALSSLWAIKPFVTPLEGTNSDGLDDLYDAVVQESGAIDCRVSTDEGTTWRYWDGSAWSTVTTQWTSFRDLNLHLDVIPFGEWRTLRLQVRLRRGTNTKLGPVLECLRIGYSILPGHEFEDQHRTFKRLLRDLTKVRLRLSYTLDSTTPSLDVEHPLSISSVVAAYNLTDDPLRLSNIATGFTGNVVDFVTSQTSGSVIEIEWDADVPVRIAHPDKDTIKDNLPHVPLLLVMVTQGSESSQARLPDTPTIYTVNYPLSKYWKEFPPVAMEYRVQVFSLAADEVLSIKMIDAAYDALRKHISEFMVRTVNTGQDVDVFDFTPPFLSLTDTSENLSSKSFTFILYVRESVGDVIEGPLADTLQVLLEN